MNYQIIYLKNFKDKIFVYKILDPKLENTLINLEVTMPQKYQELNSFLL